MPSRLLPSLIVALALFATVSARAETETWRLDPVHSQVWFRVGHLRFSHPLGRLGIENGWFRFDPEHLDQAACDVTIDLASVDLGDAKWNDAVKSSRFFDVARWPTARFYSTTVEKTGEASGTIHGQLVLHGVTKPVDVAFHINAIANDPYAFARKAGVSAQAKIERSAFGMTRFKDVVGEDIDLTIEVEGIRDRDAATSKTGKSSDGDQE